MVKTEVREKEELSLILSQFTKILYVDFGIKKLSDKIKKWYEMNWEDFKREMENHNVKWNECLVNDWKDFFHKQKTKVSNLLATP